MEKNLNNIAAKIIAHTKNAVTGEEMVTYEWELPRIILAETNTAKINNRNTQSTRAVPIKSSIENMLKNPFVPIYWGKNQAGMTAKEECNAPVVIDGVEFSREKAWEQAMLSSVKFATAFADAGYHKQSIGRLTECFQMIRMVYSGVDLDNMFNLRIHPDAQPEFRDLAIKSYLAKKASTPFVLYAGEWHLPYIDLSRDENGKIVYSKDGVIYDLEEARKISLSCCAQTSYRKQDSSLGKAEDITGKLFNGDVVHASPAEHICTPIIPYLEGIKNVPTRFESWEDGITSVDRKGRLWSGNLRGFIQFRQLIPNHTAWEFTEEKFAEYTKDLAIAK